jgi:hypothetical protein
MHVKIEPNNPSHPMFSSLVAITPASHCFVRTIILSEELRRIPGIEIIGLHGTGENVAEILVFLSAFWFVIDRIGSMRVFVPNVYLRKCQSILMNFPDDFCYEIVPEPIAYYGMDSMSREGIIKSIKIAFSRRGLKETVHHAGIVFLDVLSFFLLITWWEFWIGGYNENYTFRMSASLIFILLIHLTFMLVVLFYQLAPNYFRLFVVNIVWLLFTLVAFFWSLPVGIDGRDSSVYFYVYVRIIAHLIIAHKCRTGRVFESVKAPRFERNWRRIIFTNRFFRKCPFFFEIHTLLLWMIEKTKVKLSDFFLIRDLTLQLEILIAKQARHEARKPERKVCRVLFYLILFAGMIVTPMSFLVSADGTQVANPLERISLEVGLTEFPPFYSAPGRVVTMDEDELDALADEIGSSWREIDGIGDISVVIFPAYSTFANALSEAARGNLAMKCGESSSHLVAFYHLQLHFHFPTTSAMNCEPSLFNTRDADSDIKNGVLRTFSVAEVVIPWDLVIPRIVTVPANNDIGYLKEFAQPLVLSYESGDVWRLNMNNTDFLNESADEFKVLVKSDPVEIGKGYVDSDSGIILFYVLMVLVVGVILRDRLSGNVDELWMHRLDVPQKLYKMVMAIHLCRNAGEIEREAELVEKLLDLLRSHELVLALTSR